MGKTELIAFDLDGTLLDTAKDFLYAINILKAEYNLEPCEYREIRSKVSEGAFSLTRYAFGLSDLNEESTKILGKKLLDIYETCCLKETIPFKGINSLLKEINKANIPWGIVTNKPEFFANKIVKHFFSKLNPNFLICPEHTGERKPSPKGLIRACEINKSKPYNSFYVGDNQIDIEAGKKAKMKTVAASYGYIPEGNSVLDWKAEYIIKTPGELKNIIPELKC